MSKFFVKPTSRQAIWELVREIRRYLGVEDKLYFDIVHFVERVMPEVFPDFVFEVCTEAEMNNQHGKVRQIRFYNENHTARVDYDFSMHQGKVLLHAHDYKNGERLTARKLTEKELRRVYKYFGGTI